MAKIMTDDKEIEISDNSGITDACEELGVAIGCHVGAFKTCRIEIVEGEDNLSGLTDLEKESGMDKNMRLACQCKISSGDVKIKF